ncbi:DUF2142 domain-containing protein [Burkholderia sp. Ax-1719]|uniref:DUF2142 domain-containing protein n=1 Tax=Burkholderia sp. Ax-1719 TaxID=2608334 RepID=UPI001422EDB3|nr:DUF2142 domain-containing protein [Burkholderia sp. Ax-1719]NIE65472.1 DUF2142 domain-containing protein [Burkholderia sp. Ax-1719]
MQFYEWLGSFRQGHRLAWLYVGYALTTGLFLVLATPPFQTPDSVNHFFRAVQISEGHLLSERAGNTSGGPMDASLVDFSDMFHPLAGHQDVKMNAQLQAQSDGRQWGGERRVVEFPGTAIYPAYAYLPQAITVAFARAAHVSVSSTYRLTCIVDLLVSVALTVAALRLGRRTALWIFAVGLLPSTLMLYSSVSQEVLLLPVCFLLIAALDRAFDDGRPIGYAPLVLAALAAAACVTARPPYLGFLLLGLCPALAWASGNGAYAGTRRIGLLLAAAIVSIAVVSVGSISAWAPVPPPRSESGQIAFVLHHPFEIPRIAVATLHQNARFYFESMIGVLGWLDTHMHRDYYRVAGLMAAALAVVTLLERRAVTRVFRRVDRAIVAIVLLVCVAMIFAALYVSWTPVGQRIVEGVQGRYFLPLLPLLALLLPQRLHSVAQSRVVAVATTVCLTVVLIFPLYTFVETVEAILRRFYV